VIALSPRGRRIAVAAGLALGFAACALFLTAVTRHTRFGSSDNANALLAGAAMVRGNFWLRGWQLPNNSYWLVDLPMFGLADVLVGVRDGLLLVVPSLVAAGTITLGAVAAVAGRPSIRRWWVGAAVVGLLLGLPHEYLAIFLLQGPHHLATTLFCLGAFLLLSGARPGGARWLVATALLAVTVRSDPVAIAIGLVPVAGAGVLDAVRTRRPAALAGPLAAAAGAMLGSVLLAGALHLAGGFTLRHDTPPSTAFLAENLRATPTILGGLLGVLSHGGLKGGAKAVHWVGAALFGAGVAASLARSVIGLVRPGVSSDGPGAGAGEQLPRPSPAWVDDVLLIGCAGGVAVFALLTNLPQFRVLYARYLLPTLVFGAVLTARRAVEAAGRIPAAAAAAVLVALGLAYAGTPWRTLRHPGPVNPSRAVAGWLEARHLDRGYGQYWTAGITTVSSREAVVVRPVVNVDGRLHADLGFASRRWFDDPGPFRFMVLWPASPFGVDEPVAVANFGRPVETQDIGPYRVLVWDHDLTVPVVP
jgi:hypothetical protein